jgi:hypothetical protein
MYNFLGVFYCSKIVNPNTLPIESSPSDIQAVESESRTDLLNEVRLVKQNTTRGAGTLPGIVDFRFLLKLPNTLEICCGYQNIGCYNN